MSMTTIALDTSRAPHFNGPRIELRNFPLQVARFTLAEVPSPDYATFKAEITVIVKDRDTGKENELTFSHVAPGYEHECGWIVELVRRTVHGLMNHEVDEAWHVDGIRVNDPHVYEGT